MSFLVLCEIIGVFVNTLTDGGKYPLQNCENLRLAIQMQLSRKRKSFLQFFVPFLEFLSNYKDFEKKLIVIANVFPKLVRPLSKKPCLRTPFDS